MIFRLMIIGESRAAGHVSGPNDGKMEITRFIKLNILQPSALHFGTISQFNLSSIFNCKKLSSSESFAGTPPAMFVQVGPGSFGFQSVPNHGCSVNMRYYLFYHYLKGSAAAYYLESAITGP